MKRSKLKKKDTERLEDIAADYLHLAQDADGQVDALRRKQYRWLMKLEKLAGDGQSERSIVKIGP